jgi:hypothetical protein
MPATNADTTHPSISEQMNESIVIVMYCNFEFRKVSGGRGEKIFCCLSTMTSHQGLTT